MGSKKGTTTGNDCTAVWADNFSIQSILERLDVGGALGASHGSISRGGEGGGGGSGGASGGSSGATGSSAESTRRQGAGGTKIERTQIRSAGQRPTAPLPSSYTPSPLRRAICARPSNTSATSPPSSPARAPARGAACCDFGAQVNTPSSTDYSKRPPVTESESAVSQYIPKRCSARIAKLRAEAQRANKYSASLTDLATVPEEGRGFSGRARVRGGRRSVHRSRAAGSVLGPGVRAVAGPLRVTRTTFTRPAPTRAIKRNRPRGQSVGDATELHLAVRVGDLGRMVQLLDAGAELESRDSAGATPLHWAVRFVQTEAAQLLIDAGADVDAQVVPRGRKDSPTGQASLPAPPPHE